MRSSVWRDQKGAAIVQVAVAILGLSAFSVLVIDYGAMWVARRQAQNAADAGALAGAVSLAFEGVTEQALARSRAAAVARANLVLGEVPSVLSQTDITFPTCPDGTQSCIRVDVHRSPARGNALPAFFGPLIGVSSQRVMARATAQAIIANQVNCMKPWAVADKWIESDPGGWTPESTFDPASGDLYPNPGNGFQVFEADGSFGPDYGRLLTLKYGDPKKEWSAGWFMALSIPPGCTGGACYKEAIKGCSDVPYQIGGTLSLDNEPGNMVGPTDQAVMTDEGDKRGASLVNQDPTAFWNPTYYCASGTDPKCGGVDGSRFAVSPRVVPIPLFAPTEDLKNGRTSITIVNILGFFVDRADHGVVYGYLVTIPGNLVPGANVGNQAAFIRTIRLVQ